MIENKEYLGKEFAFSAKKSENQNNLFTKEHTRFDVAIIANGVAFNTKYQCNTKHNEPTFEDVMEALVSDASYFDCVDDIDEFSKECGFDSISATINAYKLCGETSAFIHKVFSDEELEELQELIENNWETEEISR